VYVVVFICVLIESRSDTAMGVPGVGIEASFRNPEDEVARFFQQRHKNHFMIYNLAMEKSYDFSKFDDQVISMGWPDHHAPPLQMLFQICQSLSSWLNADPLNVAAVHCKAGKVWFSIFRLVFRAFIHADIPAGSHWYRDCCFLAVFGSSQGARRGTLAILSSTLD
jgi:hypothetical protein